MDTDVVDFLCTCSQIKVKPDYLGDLSTLYIIKV